MHNATLRAAHPLSITCQGHTHTVCLLDDGDQQTHRNQTQDRCCLHDHVWIKYWMGLCSPYLFACSRLIKMNKLTLFLFPKYEKSEVLKYCNSCKPVTKLSHVIFRNRVGVKVHTSNFLKCNVFAADIKHFPVC